MKQYRIKEKNWYYYPQYKHGIRTAWLWRNFIAAYLDVCYSFDTLKKAEDFIEEDRDFKESPTIIYYPKKVSRKKKLQKIYKNRK